MNSTQEHISSAYDRDLEGIQARIMKMGGLVEQAILDAAKALADADPMHKTGARTYVMRRWLINEGSFSLSVGLSTGGLSFR